jgi:hypothetical protein
MEPRDDQKKTDEPRPAEKKRRFRIVKLEERIAPSHKGDPGHRTYYCTDFTSGAPQHCNKC